MEYLDMQRILLEKNQEIGYHSTTYKNLALMLYNGKFYCSKVEDKRDKKINNGYDYFISTHNSTYNTKKDAPELPVTIKINFRSINSFMKFPDIKQNINKHSEIDNQDIDIDKLNNIKNFNNLEYSSSFKKKVDSTQYPFNNDVRYKYEFEDRVFTNHPYIKLDKSWIECISLLIDKNQINNIYGDYNQMANFIKAISVIIHRITQFDIKFELYTNKNNFNNLRSPDYTSNDDKKKLIYKLYEIIYNNMINKMNIDQLSNKDISKSIKNLFNIINHHFNLNLDFENLFNKKSEEYIKAFLSK